MNLFKIALLQLKGSFDSDRNLSKGIEYCKNAKSMDADFGNEAFCTPGNNFHVCDLDTRAGKIKIGAMICYDREFPESARILMLKGADF